LSRPSHSRTRRLRRPRVDASGNSGPKMKCRAVSSTLAAGMRRLYSPWAKASVLATKRVPIHAASAPSANAAANPRPSATPRRQSPERRRRHRPARAEARRSLRPPDCDRPPRHLGQSAHRRQRAARLRLLRRCRPEPKPGTPHRASATATLGKARPEEHHHGNLLRSADIDVLRCGKPGNPERMLGRRPDLPEGASNSYCSVVRVFSTLRSLLRCAQRTGFANMPRPDPILELPYWHCALS
jgi:hypothetical protein